MNAVVAYRHESRVGPFFVRLNPHTLRWHAIWDDEDLGSYSSPVGAIDDLAGGHTFSASCGDTSQFGLSHDITEWIPIVSRR